MNWINLYKCVCERESSFLIQLGNPDLLTMYGLKSMSDTLHIQSSVIDEPGQHIRG